MECAARTALRVGRAPRDRGGPRSDAATSRCSSGPLIIAGHVDGQRARGQLRRRAAPDGAHRRRLLVVGGEVDGRNTRARRRQHAHLSPVAALSQDGDRIVAIDDAARPTRRAGGAGSSGSARATGATPLRVVQAGPYNRVEGLADRARAGDPASHAVGQRSAQTRAAVVRTGSSFGSERSDIGHNVRARGALRHASAASASAGASFNVVEPVEAWQMSDLEMALASFVARRDYRDYYQRHGANGFVTLYGARDLSLTGVVRRRTMVVARAARIRSRSSTASDPWRDESARRRRTVPRRERALKFDTRTDPDDPWSGWFMNADVEHGRGTLDVGRADVGPPRASRAGRHATYTRGFFDFRRYNRLGPTAQLNMRVVLGGWLGGDPLPLERRFSVDGPGALPGFDFRSARAGPDVGTCNDGAAVLGPPGASAIASRSRRSSIAAICRLDFTGNWDDWPRQLSQRARRRRVGVVRRRGPRVDIVGPHDGSA